MSSPHLKRDFSFPILKLQTSFPQAPQTWINKGILKSVLLVFCNVSKFPGPHLESVGTPLCMPLIHMPLHLVDCSDILQKQMLTDQSQDSYGWVIQEG